jgi:hypothetical protein
LFHHIAAGQHEADPRPRRRNLAGAGNPSLGQTLGGWLQHNLRQTVSPRPGAENLEGEFGDLRFARSLCPVNQVARGL